MGDIVGYRVTKRKGLDHWAALCEEWILATQRYARVVEGDASYWFNEMADVAILSGAAWRSGWVAVAETQIEKGKKHHTKHWGRADLYIGSDHHEEYIEAKHRSVSLDKRCKLGKIFEEGMIAALKDAKATSGREEKNTCGVCFFSFFYSKEVLSKKFTEEDLIDSITEAARSDSAHVAAWCFPERTRKLKGDNGKFWPGTLMLCENSQYTKRAFTP